MATPDPADRFAPTNTIAAKRADLRNEMRGAIRRACDSRQGLNGVGPAKNQVVAIRHWNFLWVSSVCRRCGRRAV